MVEKTYRCNLCRDPAPPCELIGFYWKTAISGRAVMEMVPISQSEHHLCKVCIKQIKEDL